STFFTLFYSLSLHDALPIFFFVLKRSYYYENDQTSLLDKVKSTLKKAYPYTADISRDGQAVTISFHDFKVDVVPAFHRMLSFFLDRKSTRLNSSHRTISYAV